MNTYILVVDDESDVADLLRRQFRPGIRPGHFIMEFAARVKLTDKPAPTWFVRLAGWAFEGLVSKHRDRPYQAGRSKHWIKVKNRKHPAISRVISAFA